MFRWRRAQSRTQTHRRSRSSDIPARRRRGDATRPQAGERSSAYSFEREPPDVRDLRTGPSWVTAARPTDRPSTQTAQTTEQNEKATERVAPPRRRRRVLVVQSRDCVHSDLVSGGYEHTPPPPSGARAQSRPDRARSMEAHRRRHGLPSACTSVRSAQPSRLTADGPAADSRYGPVPHSR